MNKSNPKIFIIIPAYKAEKTISSVIYRIPKSILKEIFRIVIVEDGSYIGTDSVLHKLASEFNNIELIFNKTNLGYATSQKIGLTYALKNNCDICVILHADGQYPPEYLEKLLSPVLNKKCDLVLASRMHSVKTAFLGGMPIYKIIANKALTAFANFTFQTNYTEFHSGYLIYSKEALTRINFASLSNTFHFDGEMLIMAKIKKLKVLDIPIPTHYGDEKSYLNPIIYGFQVLFIIVKFKFLQIFKKI